MEFVSWDHELPNIWKNKIVPKHQPVQFCEFFPCLQVFGIKIKQGEQCSKVLASKSSKVSSVQKPLSSLAALILAGQERDSPWIVIFLIYIYIG
jgi:hypothetical protein